MCYLLLLFAICTLPYGYGIEGLEARMLYTKGGRVWVHRLGEQKPRELGAGQFARWCPKGQRIAVSQGKNILVMNADGSDRRVVATDVQRKDGSNLDFMADGRSILYLGAKGSFRVVDTETGQRQTLELPGKFTGEPSLSANGRWFAARDGNELYLWDLKTRSRRKYAQGCSPGVSPQGTFLMNNVGDHRRLQIHHTGKGDHRFLNLPKGLDDPRWDNHHWSNHEDYLAAMGEKGPVGAYVVRVSDNTVFRVGKAGRCQYPDLFVDRAPETTARRHSGTESKPAGQLPDRLRLRVGLVERTDPGDPASLDDYRHALASDLMVTLDDHPDFPKGSELLMVHWVIRDRKRLPELKISKGGVQVELERFDRLPSLTKERLLEDVGEFDTPRYWLRRFNGSKAVGPQP